FYEIPEMRVDLINSYSPLAQGVISLSVGYFFYDFFDMAIHNLKRSSELLVHHCLVISCFGLSLCTHFYQGYSLVALLVEVNSIFLHLRQMMLLYGIQKTSSIYKLNGILNIVTFIIFRVFTMGWMLQWLVSHRTELTLTVFSLGVFSLIVIIGMNFQLLFRVWKSDYRKMPVSEKTNGTQHSLNYPERCVSGKTVGTHSQADPSYTLNGKVFIPKLDGDSPTSKSKTVKDD
ncbi:TLC domain-containing protein 2, partial [Frankliniella fusca]